MKIRNSERSSSKPANRTVKAQKTDDINIKRQDSLNQSKQAVKPASQAVKAQTSMILIILVIIVFGGLAVFLLTFAKTFSQPEYINLYSHNLLLSVMRTDTGYTDSRCRLVSDTMSCAFFESDWKCGGEGPTCLDLLNETIQKYVGSFELVQKSYRYLFIAKPEYLSGGDVLNPLTDEPLRIKVGDLGLETERVSKIVASEQVQKTTSQGPIVIKAQLILSQRKE